MIYGADYLGGVKYQRALLSAHPQGWAAGIFLRTFGDALKTVEQMAASGKFAEIVVHTAPFDNSHRYPVSALLPQVLGDARKLNAIALKNPGCSILISPFCEHNHPAKVMAPVFQRIKAAAPTCECINSIWKGQVVPGICTEIHIESRKRLPKIPAGEYTVSFDGFGGDGSGDFTDADIGAILDYYVSARHIRWWNFRCNGKFGHKDKTPVSKRTCWPDAKYLKGHNAMMKEREGQVTWPKTALYKPFADDHGQGGKDNKAMVILPQGSEVAEVLDSKGTVIDRMKRTTPDHTGSPKGKRYYSGKYAYELGDIAERNTGSRLISIRSGRTQMPLTDADLRSGLFR